MNSDPTDSTKEPSEAALVAAYQITAKEALNESQLIWRRTAIFITVHGIIAAFLLPDMNPRIGVLVVFAGWIYILLWFFSMERMWTYYYFYYFLMQEQEEALRLNLK
jgi:hypothetical protein